MLYGVIGNTTVFGTVFSSSSLDKATNKKFVWFLKSVPIGSLFFFNNSKYIK